MAVDAFADVFYVFLTHGDAVWCLMRRNYPGEEFDGVVGGGVGVVKRRQVGGYRGSAVARWLWEVDRVSSSSRSSSSTSCEGVSSAVSSNWCLGVRHCRSGRYDVKGRVCVVSFRL